MKNMITIKQDIKRGMEHIPFFLQLIDLWSPTVGWWHCLFNSDSSFQDHIESLSYMSYYSGLQQGSHLFLLSRYVVVSFGVRDLTKATGCQMLYLWKNLKLLRDKLLHEERGLGNVRAEKKLIWLTSKAWMVCRKLFPCLMTKKGKKDRPLNIVKKIWWSEKR